MRVTRLLATAALAVSSAASSTYVSYGDYTKAGCYTSISGFTEVTSGSTMSSLACLQACQEAGYTVYATQDQACYCSNSMPSSSDLTDDSTCSTTCPAYPSENCGGTDAYSVGYEGTTAPDSSSSASASAASGSSSATASSSSSTESSTSTASSSSSSSSSTSSASTSSESSSSSSSSSSSTSSSSSSSSLTSSSSSPSSSSASSASSSAASASASGSSDSGGGGISGGAIAGIVIGVVVALVAIGAVLVFLKRRRTKDEYYSPSSSPAGFGNFKEPFGVRPPEPAYGAGVMAVDQRLNPVMLGERRISEGSLADARDYSRKILRVANPDDEA